MKIICTKTKEINTKTSCKKEYCCEKLREAFGDITTDSHRNYYSNFTVDEKSNKVSMSTHHDYDGDSTCDGEGIIDYCPFCGTRLIVENIKIDNTDKLPKEPPLETIYDYKKDNLWTWFKEWFRFKQ